MLACTLAKAFSSYMNLKMQFSSLFGALALITSVTAQNATYCASGNVCYAINVPSNTASTGMGDIYFQMTGPTTLSWIGLGQGESMSGSNIFIMYSNAAGDNITLSPRLGVGNRQPAFATTAQLTLLKGSGIANGIMTANVRCSNCQSWSGGSMSFNDPNSKWIWSYKSGTPIASDNTTLFLAQHSNFGDVTLNLQHAAGGDTSNPFIGVAAAETDGESSEGGKDSEPAHFEQVVMAHGIISSIAFVLFFPLGAIGIRLLSFPGLVWIHAGWMFFTYTMALASMGMGVWLAVMSHALDNKHSIIGLVVVGCLLFQPLSGLIHHLLYKKTGRANAATYPHVWWGRAVVTLGIINGGLGLQLADNTTMGEIAYGVVAGVMWLLWMIVIALAFFRSRNSKDRSETGTSVAHDKRNDSSDGDGTRASNSVHKSA